MKKFLVLILVLMVVLLTGCQQQDDTSSIIDSSFLQSTIEDDNLSDESDKKTEETVTPDDATSSTDSDNTSQPQQSESTVTDTIDTCENLGHNFIEKRTESTCTQKGTITRTCSRCGNSSTEYLKLKSHSYTNQITPANDTHHNNIYTCSICNYSYTKTDSHYLDSWRITKQPTQAAAGEQSRSCTLCGYTQKQTIPQLSSASEILIEVFNLINIERKKEGLSPLAYYYAGQPAADIRANEIIESFSHTRPNGTTCFTALDEANVSYHCAGENIARGQLTPEEVMEDWMNSSGHRANILNAAYTHVIVGYKDNAWVQLFIGI